MIAMIAVSQPLSAFGDPPSPSATEIGTWIDGLQSNEFAVREWATQSLVAAGGPVIEPLANSIENVDIESMERGLAILHSLAVSETTTSQQAEDALRRLAANRATTSAQRANDALRSIRTLRTERAERILRRLGADFDQIINTSYTYAYGSYAKTVTIGDNWKGTAEDLVYVSWLTGYPRLAVKAQGKEFKDEHLFQIAKATNIVSLNLSRAGVTDYGMAAVGDMSSLQDLRIYYCDVSDKCLQFIDGDSSALKTFSIFGSKISADAFNKLMEKHSQIAGRYGVGGFLGISGEAERTGKGCLVKGVTPNEAASKAGILANDVITEYNGQIVTEFLPAEQLSKLVPPVIPQPNPKEETEKKPALSELIGQNAPGDRVKIKILRHGRYIMKEVELGEWP